MVKIQWVKPTLGDDWGSLYVIAGPRNMSAWGTWGISNEPKERILLSGQKIEIKWPDGTVETVTLGSRRARQNVSDMGHSYSVDSEIPTIEVKVHGTITTVDLDKAGVKVRAK